MLILSFLIGVFALQYVLVMAIGIIYIRKERTGSPLKKSISVVVPFKNEASRIKGLVESLNNIEGLNDVEFIFVNDHSLDDTTAKLEELQVPFELISNAGQGKKEAIKCAVNQAKGDFILTWDADVRVPANYFSAINELADADMWILPVRAYGNKFIQRLEQVEATWLQLLCVASCRLNRPILASGANLLFRRDAFLKVDDKREDYGIASGDDMFLLKAFQQEGMQVKCSNADELTVETESAVTLWQLVAQRKRWAGKMKGLANFTSGSAFFILVLIQFLFIASFNFAYQLESWYYLLPLFIKYFNELIFLQFYRKGRSFGSDFFYVFMHQFFYPIFLVLVTLPNRYKDQKWESKK